MHQSGRNVPNVEWLLRVGVCHTVDCRDSNGLWHRAHLPGSLPEGPAFLRGALGSNSPMELSLPGQSIVVPSHPLRFFPENIQAHIRPSDMFVCPSQARRYAFREDLLPQPTNQPRHNRKQHRDRFDCLGTLVKKCHPKSSLSRAARETWLPTWRGNPEDLTLMSFAQVFLLRNFGPVAAGLPRSGYGRLNLTRWPRVNAARS